MLSETKLECVSAEKSVHGMRVGSIWQKLVSTYTI